MLLKSYIYIYTMLFVKIALTWCMIGVDMKAYIDRELFSFQSLIVLCLAANNIFTITLSFFMHARPPYTYAYGIFGWTKGMCYSHQYSNVFTSVPCLIIKFDYPNICFKVHQQNVTYDMKSIPKQEYAKKIPKLQMSPTFKKKY